MAICLVSSCFAIGGNIQLPSTHVGRSGHVRHSEGNHVAGNGTSISGVAILQSNVSYFCVGSFGRLRSGYNILLGGAILSGNSNSHALFDVHIGGSPLVVSRIGTVLAHRSRANFHVANRLSSTEGQANLGQVSISSGQNSADAVAVDGSNLAIQLSISNLFVRSLGNHNAQSISLHVALAGNGQSFAGHVSSAGNASQSIRVAVGQLFASIYVPLNSGLSQNSVSNSQLRIGLVVAILVLNLLGIQSYLQGLFLAVAILIGENAVYTVNAESRDGADLVHFDGPISGNIGGSRSHSERSTIGYSDGGAYSGIISSLNGDSTIIGITIRNGYSNFFSVVVESSSQNLVAGSYALQVGQVRLGHAGELHFVGLGVGAILRSQGHGQSNHAVGLAGIILEQEILSGANLFGGN